MNKMTMTILAAVGAGIALADVSVLDVKCTPRSPWNGLVDVSYTIACDDPDADVYVNPVAYDGDRRLTLFPSSFTGDGATNAVKAGHHSMVWDAMKDFGAFSSANFQLKIYAGKRLPRYVWVDLSSGSDSTNYPVHYSVVGPDVTKNDCRTTQLWMRLVPPGEFWMGSPEGEIGHSDYEKQRHVRLTKPFYIGVFEITQGQWMNVMGSCTSYFSKNRLRPVECVPFYVNDSSYSTPQIRGLLEPNVRVGYRRDSFISKIIIRTQNGGWDLPTEAQWEYACRAGTTTSINNGKDLTDDVWSQNLAEVAGYYGNCHAGQAYYHDSETGTRVVGSFKPNSLSLYDMLGNVMEICRDEGSYYYYSRPSGTLVDPVPGGIGVTRQYRVKGGSWLDKATLCRSGMTGRIVSEADERINSGFRVVCLDGF